jgi:hypothetical protein
MEPQVWDLLRHLERYYLLITLVPDFPVHQRLGHTDLRDQFSAQLGDS